MILMPRAARSSFAGRTAWLRGITINLPVIIMSGWRLAASFRCAVILLETLLISASAWGAPPVGLVTRTLTLADMGLSEQVILSNRNFEQHFYFPLPQGVELEDAHVEIVGTYLHPFAATEVVTLLVNGTPVSAYRLQESGGELPSAAPSSKRPNGGAVRISLPLHGLRTQGDFLDLGVVLSSQIDATRCVGEFGRGNELSIDTKATRLVYSFEGNSVRDIRGLLSTLPRRPLILLPSRHLDAAQYSAALRLSQALSNIGLQPEFAVVPQVGEAVDTALVADVAKISSVRIPGVMADAIAQHRPYKITKPAEAAAWLALRIMSQGGLAHFVIDPDQTGQSLLAALRAMDSDSKTVKELWNKLGMDGAGNWLFKPTLDKANMRIATLAGQPILTLESDDWGNGADMLASSWLQIAGSRELALSTALHLFDRESSLPHIHIASSTPVQNMSGKAEWVVPIPFGGLPQGRWPDSFELNLMAAPSGDSQPPVVSVFMNDNLLTAALLRTDGEITRLHAHIPMYAYRADNQLRVEIRRRIAGEHCSSMAQGFPVQMLPSSYLNLRGAQEATQFFMLGAEFTRNSEIVIPSRYLRDAAGTLPVVSSVLRGLSFGETNFRLVVDAMPGFKPSHTFIAFESEPESDMQRVVAGNGRLIVRSKPDRVIFDSAGLGSMAVLQLIRSGRQPGVRVITVDGVLPALRKPLKLSAGNLAIAGPEGVRLAVNLDDPDNDWQLDEQNRGVLTFIQRYRTWLITLGLMLLPVIAVLGLRWHFRNRRIEGSEAGNAG